MGRQRKDGGYTDPRGGVRTQVMLLDEDRALLEATADRLGITMSAVLVRGLYLVAGRRCRRRFPRAPQKTHRPPTPQETP